MCRRVGSVTPAGDIRHGCWPVWHLGWIHARLILAAADLSPRSCTGGLGFPTTNLARRMRMDVHAAVAARLPAELAERHKKPSKWTAPAVIALLAVASILS